MHNESLSHHDLPGHLDFLKGALGFGSSLLRALEGLRKFGCLCLGITLQGLALLDGVLELLLNLADPGLVLLARGVFLGRFVLGLL